MKVAIDPGHGGRDSGAVCDPLVEKRLNREFADILVQVLSTKHEIILTRVQDGYVGLRERCRIANSLQADVFISCHHNASQPHRAQGYEILYYPHSGLGKAFATKIVKKLQTRLRMKCRGAKCGWYRGQVGKHLTVLRRTRMPAIIIEAGFLDNKHDRDAFLLSKTCRHGIYAIIAFAILEVLNEGII